MLPPALFSLSVHRISLLFPFYLFPLHPNGIQLPDPFFIQRNTRSLRIFSFYPDIGDAAFPLSPDLGQALPDPASACRPGACCKTETEFAQATRYLHLPQTTAF